MGRRKKYDPSKCGRRIIAQFENKCGNKIALFAHHAFHWHVYTDIDGRIEMIGMPREKARQEYDRLKRLYS